VDQPDVNPISSEVDSPQTILSARVDDKGRLDVPGELVAYLESAGITKLFITTPDLRTGRIYPNEIWKHNQKVFLDQRGTPGMKRVAFLSRVHGDYGIVDKAGRLLLPAKLREALHLNQRQTVWLEVHNGVINILTQSVYEETFRDAVANNAADLETAEGLGFI
jgi:DNA-binding transcriptional regulator/RsmH inhibitor MraZ